MQRTGRRRTLGRALRGWVLVLVHAPQIACFADTPDARGTAERAHAQGTHVVEERAPVASVSAPAGPAANGGFDTWQAAASTGPGAPLEEGGALTATDYQRVPGDLLAQATTLELAALDRDVAAETGSCGADLAGLAQAAPALRTLILSGCGHLAERHLDVGAPLVERLVLRNLELGPADLAALGRLPQLRTLELENVRTRSVTSLTSLRDLSVEVLVLRDLSARSILGALPAVLPARLRKVAIEGAWADSRTLAPLSAATGLEQLEVRDTRAGNYGLRSVANLPSLASIVLEGRGFGDPTPLYLRHLPLASFTCLCPRFGDAGVGHLRHLRRLRSLRLSGTAATPGGLARLARLTGLVELVLEDAVVDEAVVAAIGGLSELAHLSLVGGRVTASSLAPWGGLGRLTSLVLATEGVDDRLLRTLDGCPALVRLSLRGTSVSDAALPHVAKWQQLALLDLSGTRVTRDLSPLVSLRHLAELDLADTDLVDAALPHLGRIQNLRRIDLRNTLLSAAAASALADLPELRYVDLRGTGVGPSEAVLLTREGVAVESGPAGAP